MMHLSNLKSQFNLTLLAIASGFFTSILPNPVQAQIEQGFQCNADAAMPTTIYYTSQGEQEPWIKWVSEHFSNSNWSPLARCQTVSQRLEQYREDGKLKYVTLGTENNQPIICVASQDNGPCEGIIYTLKPGQDGIAALNNLFAWGSGQQNLDSSYESSTAIPYIDVGTKLEQTESN